MGKKGKGSVAEEKEMTPLFTDTTCTREADITTWEGMYSVLEEENPRVMEVTVTAEYTGHLKHHLLNLHVHSCTA